MLRNLNTILNFFLGWEWKENLKQNIKNHIHYFILTAKNLRTTFYVNAYTALYNNNNLKMRINYQFHECIYE